MLEGGKRHGGKQRRGLTRKAGRGYAFSQDGQGGPGAKATASDGGEDSSPHLGGRCLEGRRAKCTETQLCLSSTEVTSRVKRG